ncbi:MAG: lipoate--protein ligase [Calditrichaeota bacterium]|nr:MAG: lipoate--protein ligase [Calditrichota bacterium]
MYLLHSESHDPLYHAALEEYLVRSLPADMPVFLTYINAPAVVIGKNQIPWRECALEQLDELGMTLCRRVSGGGTVVHDPGNLNFAFIVPSDIRHVNNYAPFLEPIAAFLQKIGVPATLNERNDLVMDGFKISGNAQFTSRGRMISHGTLLFNSDLKRLKRALAAPSVVIESKARASVRSPVACISERLTFGMTMEEFRQELEKNVGAHFGVRGDFVYDENIDENVGRMVREKYASHDWLYGRTPLFFVHSVWEDQPIRVTVRNGRFWGIEGTDSAWWETLYGTPYRYQTLYQAFVQNVEIKPSKPYTHSERIRGIYPFYES